MHGLVMATTIKNLALVQKALPPQKLDNYVSVGLNN